MENDREAAAAGMTEQEKTESRAAEAREDSIRREYSFAPDVKLKECRFCRVMIPKKAKVCPNCRMNLKRHWFRNLAAAVFAIAVIGVGGYYLSGHWGIMQDAVISVWMAQKGTAVPAVSVTTVDTVEMASGAAAAEPFEVAVAGESDEKTVQETPGEAGGQAEETAETAELPETDPEAESEEVQKAADSKETDELQEGTEPTGSRKAVQVQELSEENGTSDDMEAVGETAENEDQKDNVQVEDRDQEEQTFREECSVVSYKALLRDMETYLNTALKVEAEVICQVGGGLFDENIYYFCMHEEKSGIKRYYIIRDDRETDDTLILEGDMLTVYGQLFGSCKLPADLIETRPTVPAVSMMYYDLTEE